MLTPASIDVQKMNWKFRTGVHEQTGVCLQRHCGHHCTGGYTREPWLTDKTQTLSFSGCFLVLKHKTRLATFSILLLRGHRWFRIRLATEVHRRDQLVALRESILHPMPANLQITRSPKPMRVHQ